MNAIGFGIVALGYYGFVAAMLFGSFYWNSWGLWWIGIIAMFCAPSLKSERTGGEG